MAHRRIGQVLVDMGFITDEQQELLVDEQHEHPGQLLGKVAIDMGLINDEQLAQALAEQLSLHAVVGSPTSRSRKTCWRWSPRRWRRCIASCPSSSTATR